MSTNIVAVITLKWNVLKLEVIFLICSNNLNCMRQILEEISFFITLFCPDRYFFGLILSSHL